MSDDGGDPRDEIAPGRRLVRLGGDKGQSLGERLLNQLHRLTWRTPLHTMRLKGRFPLKLLAVPADPLPGDAKVGLRMIGGTTQFAGASVDLAGFDFNTAALPVPLATYLQRFDWLRDLAATDDRANAVPVAEGLTRAWLKTHGEKIADEAWMPASCGWRILNWSANAPLILSSTDLIYRSAVLNALARTARHSERGADRVPHGNGRIAAWAGVVAAGLLIPGGEQRRNAGEAALQRALAAGVGSDGGVTSRSPRDQVELIRVLAMLLKVYEVRRETPPAMIGDTLHGAVSALLGVQMGDGALSSWQSAGPVPAAEIAAIVAASGVRTRPLRQAREWGYQRLSAKDTVVVVDAGPPPASRLETQGCASTLAFELADGPHRLIVNCGGATGRAALPDALVSGLRTTAAHSTLVLNNSNSTAIHADGALGSGVNAVDLDRRESDDGSCIVLSHDGYGKRYGMIHRRTLTLAANGRELTGEDVLVPLARRGKRASRAPTFAIRFHLAPGVETTPTADGQAVLLRIEGGALWQFRCLGGALAIEPSLWIDAEGHAVSTSQFVVIGNAASGGASVSWLLKRAG